MLGRIFSFLGNGNDARFVKRLRLPASHHVTLTDNRYGHRHPNQKSGFSLIEILIVLAIAGALFAFSYLSYSGYIDAVKLKAAAKKVVSDLRMAQDKAKTENQTYEISFSGNSYTILPLKKSINLPSGITANTITFKFASSGFPPPGFFGTLILSSKNNSKKIILSSVGRIRVG